MSLTSRGLLAAAGCLLMVAASGCNKQAPVTGHLLHEGERCDKDVDCDTGLCVALPGADKLCTRTCESGCHGEEICTSFGTGTTGKLRAGCVPNKPGLCLPCGGNPDCAYAADVCLNVGGSLFCGRDCSYNGACPDGYSCSDATAASGETVKKQCVPKSATCACTPSSKGQQRPCQNKNEFGACTGMETCDGETGFTGCDARVPAAETCNGVDDDCNGKTDDAVPDITCGVGGCQVTVPGCLEGKIPTCTPKDPAAVELCNGIDDNCDGRTDEGFDLKTDIANCGTCGHKCITPHATPGCQDGNCVILKCDDGYDDCDGKVDTGCEANLSTDVKNCGSCNSACNLAFATSKCQDKKCAVDKCIEGHWDNDGDPTNGCEYACTLTNGGKEICDHIDNDCNGVTDDGIDLTTDVDNCGKCGNVCTSPNGTPGCVNSTCTSQCNHGWKDCDPKIPGCETNIDSSTDNCGDCGIPCQPKNATGKCVGGGCTILSCTAPWEDCDKQVSNGCEIDTQTDPAHCGDCLSPCTLPNGKPGCVSGKCTIGSCNAPFANCDGLFTSGCGVNTDTDLDNCGKCNKQCAGGANATATCIKGGCGLACSGPYQNCDKNDQNGCESNKNTDANNCGFCGNVCTAPAGAKAVCNNGGCGFVCLDGYLDCDGKPDNGCEVNKNTDTSNCGSCFNVCSSYANATTVCNTGKCGFNCNGTWQDCDGRTDNGCESDKTSDANNCNGCGKPCPNRPNSTPTCVNSTCGISCTVPYLDCDKDPVTGCEANSTSDPLHCASCNACPTPPHTVPTCTTSSCGYNCAVGYADCDPDKNNGCEVTLDTLTPNNTPATQHCGGAIVDLGAVDGDSTTQIVLPAVHDRGEVIYKFRLHESDSGGTCIPFVGCFFTIPLTADVTLQGPTGAVYGLVIALGTCNSNPQTFAGTSGSPVDVLVCAPDNAGLSSDIDDSIDVFIEVLYQSGSNCGNWTLTITGSVPGSC